MGAIRIVFFDPHTKAVVATAKLDVTNTVDAADGMTVTAKMYLYELAPAVSYTETSEAQKDKDDATVIYTKNADDTYTVVDKTADDYVATGEYYVKVEGAVTEVKLTDNKLMALTQNTPHALSVLVYLDGKDVGNEDVAATVAQSMTGTMNLQFASSANLVPMNYTPLMNQGGNGGTTETTTPANPEG
jgi:hypothetical protein